MEMTISLLCDFTAAHEEAGRIIAGCQMQTGSVIFFFFESTRKACLIFVEEESITSYKNSTKVLGTHTRHPPSA
jgi:hypothetical protein